MTKTANELYREYKAAGGDKTFKSWISEQKQHGFVNADGTTDAPVNKPLSDSLHQLIDQMHRRGGYQDELTNKYIFGIHRNIWIAAGITAVVIGGYVVYKKLRK